MKNCSDPELFTKVQQNNQRAFAVLMDRYSSRLYDYIFRRTRDDDHTRDLMQDIFISLWNRRETVAITDSAWPYLCQSAKYAVIDLLVSNRRLTGYRELLIVQDAPTVFNAEDELIAGELRQQYEAALSRMPDTMQQVFRLSRNEQLSAKEIARKLGLSEQTVRNNLTMALQKLRLSLGPDQLISCIPLAMVIIAYS